MRNTLLLTLLASALSLGCGGGPTTQPDDATAAPEAPDPDQANPCDATTIDPTENPCAEPAPAPSEGDRAIGEDDTPPEG